MPAIVWLASYPKSGNTWVRAFLTAYSREGRDLSINDIEGGPIASSRDVFDDYAGVSASDLTTAEITAIRSDVYRRRAADADEVLFIKAHDAFETAPNGSPLFPPDVTRGVIYVIRHPGDIAVSLAHHANISVDDAIARMARPDFMLSQSSDRLDDQLPQHLRSWSGHIASWVDESGLPCHVVRYEDMQAHAESAFRGIVTAIGMEVDRPRMLAAIGACQFDRMQSEERAVGFKERPPAARGLFFREGRVGGWRTALTPAQIERIETAHRPMMERFGYLEPR